MCQRWHFLSGSDETWTSRFPNLVLPCHDTPFVLLCRVSLLLMSSPLAHILVFSLIMTSVLAGAHYYLWVRLVRDAKLPKRSHRILTYLVVALLISQPAVFVLSRGLPREAVAPFAFAGYLWMGMLSTYFVLLSTTEIATKLVGWLHRLRALVFRKTRAAELPDAERRLALGRLLAGGVALGGTSLGGVAVAQAMAGFRVEKVEIELAKLPARFDGFTILQMSDIHVGPTIGRDFVEAIVKTANEQRADLIAITGDLVDGSVEHLKYHTEPLGRLVATHGAVFVTGNHEYYSGAEDWIEELRRLGIPTLRNDAMRVEREGDSLLVAGVTDHRAGTYGDAPDLARALRDRRPSEEVILLAHQPREIYQAQRHDVGLQLSGHTHGGQFWPWNWVIYLIEPVVKGLARFGRTQIYVNSGTGYWGPPMRMGTRSEITLVRLRSL